MSGEAVPVAQWKHVATLLIKNIGEFFTGDIARPQAAVTSLLVDGNTIAALDPPPDTKADAVLDVGGSAVMPGLVDGHVHPVFGEWTPTQDTIGWIGNYLHGGTTTFISACELHVPGLDYENLTPDLVTSLAVVTAATTGRVRWSGARVHAGTVILVPGMTEAHFDRLAEAKSILAKFIFFPLAARKDEALRYTQWCRARGIRTKVHTGGVSRSGLSQICGYDVLAWLKPDVAAHVSGGPIPMSDGDLDRLIDDTTFALEICSSGNDRSTHRAVNRLRDKGQLSAAHARHRHAGRHRRDPARHAAQHLRHRLGLRRAAGRGDCGCDRQHRARPRPRRRHPGARPAGGPGGVRAGRGLGRHLDRRRHRPRRPAGHRLCHRRRRDRGERAEPPDPAAQAHAAVLLLRRPRRRICGELTGRWCSGAK